MGFNNQNKADERNTQRGNRISIGDLLEFGGYKITAANSEDLWGLGTVDKDPG